jgi:hypothetical protein
MLVILISFVLMRAGNLHLVIFTVVLPCLSLFLTGYGLANQIELDALIVSELGMGFMGLRFTSEEEARGGACQNWVGCRV